MKKIPSLILIILFINLAVCPISLAREVLLENGTRVRLKLADKVSTAFNNEGDEVNFTVAEDVKLGDTVLIGEGERAVGLISELYTRGRVGKAGRLTINLEHVKAINGKRVALTGSISRKGEEKIILSGALALLAGPPVSLLFLLMRGTDAQIPEGYQYQARIDRDTILVLDEYMVPVTNTLRK